jgi:hypothetical protein
LYVFLPLNTTIVFASISRWYLRTKACKPDTCIYVDEETKIRYEKPCKEMESDGKYLPHTIDRLTTKPYCKYIKYKNLPP